MYVMGVINSRRLGRSLGLDVIGADGVKRCNFNCVYCEVGNGRYETKRGVYADFDVAIKELEEHITSDIDVITFSGNGEPTLSSDLGRYIDEIHKISDIPVCVITNSSLLSDEQIKKELMNADIVMPSIDSCNTDSFNKIDRPRGLKLESIMKSIIEFSNDYNGKLYLEILFVKNFNDSDADIESLISFVKKVKLDELHINTIDRVPAEKVELFSIEEKKTLLNRFQNLDIKVRMF